MNRSQGPGVCRAHSPQVGNGVRLAQPSDVVVSPVTHSPVSGIAFTRPAEVLLGASGDLLRHIMFVVARRWPRVAFRRRLLGTRLEVSGRHRGYHVTRGWRDAWIVQGPGVLLSPLRRGPREGCAPPKASSRMAAELHESCRCRCVGGGVGGRGQSYRNHLLCCGVPAAGFVLAAGFVRGQPPARAAPQPAPLAPNRTQARDSHTASRARRGACGGHTRRFVELARVLGEAGDTPSTAAKDLAAGAEATAETSATAAPRQPSSDWGKAEERRPGRSVAPEMERLQPRQLFKGETDDDDDEELRPDDNEPECSEHMRRTQGIDRKVVNLEKQLDEPEAQTERAIQSSEERLTTLQLGGCRKEMDSAKTRSTASVTAPADLTPMRVILDGWDSKTRRATIVIEAAAWLRAQSKELRRMFLEPYAPTKYGAIAKMRCRKGECEAAALKLQQSIKDSGRTSSPT